MLNHHKKIGLALGGGVARGIAHLGVLSALEEAGLPIDCVVGTSAGSVIGAVYCAGYGLEKAIHIASRMSWWNIAAPVWPAEGFFSFARMERFLTRELGDLSFSDLHTPYAAVAADIDTGEEVILCEGRLALAVRASCSVPGLVAPVKINGRRLVDGSIANTLPVSVARRMGAETVIGVDIFSPAIRRFWGAPGLGLAALEILVQNAGNGCRQADILICPSLSGKSYLRFSRWRELFELGRQAAREKLPEILTMLSI
jgi:NTE family protein